MGHNCRKHEFPVCFMYMTDKFCYSVAVGLCRFIAASLKVETKELSKTKTNFEVNNPGLHQD
jgi:hypothetical protein